VIIYEVGRLVNGQISSLDYEINWQAWDHQDV